MADIHTEKLSIYDYDFDENRIISDFEKQPHVEHILSSYQARRDDALEKFSSAEMELDRSCDEFQDALNAVANEDWHLLSSYAEEHGIWDPDTDPQYFRVKEEKEDDLT